MEQRPTTEWAEATTFELFLLQSLRDDPRLSVDAGHDNLTIHCPFIPKSVHFE